MSDTFADGLPTDRMTDPAPAHRSLHDKAVNDGPTTANGLLSRQPETLDDRLIAAQFATQAAAATARERLLQAGVADSAITIAPHAADNTAVNDHTRPADDTLIGRIREAISPDEPSAGARAAIQGDHTLMEVRPTAAQVDLVVGILEASAPVRFDADLERWRNKG